MSAATAANRACSSRRIWCWAARASAIAIPTTSRLPSTRPCSAAACPRACSSASARSAGLVYGIHCFNTAYADGGLFGIYAGTGEDDLAELVPAVCEEFAGVADTLSEAELVRARNQIKAGTLMALESSGARSEQAARHLIIHGRPIPYAEIVTRIEAVDQDAVRRVARRLLQGKLTLAALGPIDELEPLDKIAARLAA